MTAHEEALAKMKRLHPKVWRRQYWTSEALTFGVVFAGLIAFAYLAGLGVVYAGGWAALLQALRP